MPDRSRPWPAPRSSGDDHVQRGVSCKVAAWALSCPLFVVKVGVLDSWHDVLDDEVRHRPQHSVAQLVDQICPGGHIVSLSKQTSEGDAGPRLGIEPTDRDHVVAAQQRLDVLSDDALSFRSAQDKSRRSSGQVDEEAQTGTDHPDIFPRRWRLFGRTPRLGERSLTGQERTPNEATERHVRTLVNSATGMPTCWAWRRRAGHRTAPAILRASARSFNNSPFPSKATSSRRISVWRNKLFSATKRRLAKFFTPRMAKSYPRAPPQKAASPWW